MSERPAAALLPLIADRNTALSARLEAAIEMNLLDSWMAEQILSEKMFIIEVLNAQLNAHAVDQRPPSQEAAALEINRRIDRARLHLDAPQVDYHAVRGHLEAALEWLARGG